MEKRKYAEALEKIFLRENGLVIERDRTPAASNLKNVRSSFARTIREIGKSGNLDLILASEKAVLQNDLDRYANSPAMANSLKTAMAELDAAEKLVAKVRDPAAYALVDESHSLPKNRKGGVPRDEARQFFSSHAARLLNQDKSRLDAEEKAIVDERKKNMRTAETLYAAEQRRALGLEQAQERDRGRTR